MRPRDRISPGAWFKAALIVAIVFMPATAAASLDPRSVLQIARTGATDLALKQAEAAQAASRHKTGVWAQWERVRIEIEQSRGDWQAVVDRVAALPSNAPAELRRWVLIQGAEAELARGHGAGARKLLAGYRKASSPQADARGWRQANLLLIRAFVIDGEFGKARSRIAAWRKQHPDTSSPQLDRIEARLRLLRHNPARAFELLAKAQDTRVLPLKWIAGLRAGKLEPTEVKYLSDALLAKNPATASRRAALIVGAEAALDLGDVGGRVQRLEQAVTISTTARGRQPPFALNADDVWKALIGFGRVLEEKQHLRPGDGAARIRAAAQQKQHPMRAQALLATVAFGNADADIRAQAHERLADLLLHQQHGGALLRQLYLHSKRFPKLAAVPVSVRYRLAGAAIHDDRMMAAAKVLATLDQPPARADKTKWRLERARAFILTGRAKAGIAAIDALLASGETFAFGDLQPSLFALQSIGRDRDAIRIFRELLSRKPPPKVRQKLLFWLGDSQRALHQYQAAAKRYLQSATTIDAAAMDQWARSARYAAAGALAEAGLGDDARRVYQRLLNAASDPDRRATLRQRIAELPVSAKHAKP